MEAEEQDLGRYVMSTSSENPEPLVIGWGPENQNRGIRQILEHGNASSELIPLNSVYNPIDTFILIELSEYLRSMENIHTQRALANHAPFREPSETEHPILFTHSYSVFEQRLYKYKIKANAYSRKSFKITDCYQRGNLVATFIPGTLKWKVHAPT